MDSFSISMTQQSPTSNQMESSGVVSPGEGVAESPYANGFDIRDPIELLFLVDEDIQSGRVKLHKWQAQEMIDFSDLRHTKDHPYIDEIAAANGSGKDMYIVAANAVWLCMKYRKALCAITNGSGNQLDGQTASHIENLCHKVNKKLGFPVWKINYRYFECIPTGSKMELFATDEAGKAEGYHPQESGAKFAIFVSEAKSVPDDIFNALTRCTGYSHWVDVSSPGNTFGYFYTQWNDGIERGALKDIKDCPPTGRIKRQITAFDCAHITPNQIELFAQGLIAEGGKESPIYKSGVECQFGTKEDMTVLSHTQLHNCKIARVDWLQEQFNHAGLDLSSGGESESALKIRNGNKIIGTEGFRFADTEDNIDYCEELFFRWGLDNDTSLIWGDCCGAGYPQLCALKKRGWTNIRFFDSRHASSRPKVYKNIITEMWFKFAELVQTKQVILDDDKLTRIQLVTRYYKRDVSLKSQLLSKLEQKSKGYPSPDRADATIYSFIGYKSSLPSDPLKGPSSAQPEKRRPGITPPSQPKVKGHFDMRMLRKSDGRPQDRLPKRPDFTYLQEQVDHLNQQRKQQEQKDSTDAITI